MKQATATEPSGGQAKDKAEQVARQAEEKAQQAAGQAKGRLRDQVNRRSTQVGDQVASAARDVRTVGEELRKQGRDKPAQLVDQGAQRAERLGAYLKESDADRILGDIEDFGRKQPWAIVVGGLALGFLGSRFLKASSQTRYEASVGQSSAARGL